MEFIKENRFTDINERAKTEAVKHKKKLNSTSSTREIFKLNFLQRDFDSSEWMRNGQKLWRYQLLDSAQC